MLSQEPGTAPAYFSRQSGDANWHLKLPLQDTYTLNALLRMPERSTAQLPYRALSVLPGLLKGQQSSSLPLAHSTSALSPKINYQGTCTQFYEPTTHAWPLTADLLSSRSFCWVCISGHFSVNSFSCLELLWQGCGGHSPLLAHSAVGVEEVPCCSDEMCLELWLLSQILQQIPGLQRW